MMQRFQLVEKGQSPSPSAAKSWQAPTRLRSVQTICQSVQRQPAQAEEKADQPQHRGDEMTGNVGTQPLRLTELGLCRADLAKALLDVGRGCRRAFATQNPLGRAEQHLHPTLLALARVFIATLAESPHHRLRHGTHDRWRQI